VIMREVVDGLMYVLIDRLSVARDPERPAAEKHGLRLLWTHDGTLRRIRLSMMARGGTWATLAAGCSGPGPRRMPESCFGHCRFAPMNGNPPRS
jgi:hypothetical protein